MKAYEKMGVNENIGWCKPISYRDGKVVLAKSETGIVSAQIDDADIRIDADGLATIAKTITDAEEYEFLHDVNGFSDEQIICETFGQELGCAECPWRDVCEAMDIDDETGSVNPELLTYRVYRYTDAYEDEEETLAEILAEDASSAIEAYCGDPKYDQEEDLEYTWGCKINMIDADTRGKAWARASVDTKGGINWNETVYAELVEEATE